MGYRLQGQPLKRTTDREMLSHGLLPGVVQVPHNGQPIVLMNDAQTTGGYPRIAASSMPICTSWRRSHWGSRSISWPARWRRR